MVKRPSSSLARRLFRENIATHGIPSSSRLSISGLSKGTSEREFDPQLLLDRYYIRLSS